MLSRQSGKKSPQMVGQHHQDGGSPQPVEDGEPLARGRIGAYRSEHSVSPLGAVLLCPTDCSPPHGSAKFQVAGNVECGSFRPPAMIDHAPEAVIMVTPRARSRGFLVWLALITLVPLIGLPLALKMAQVRDDVSAREPHALRHHRTDDVPATGFFYADPAFRPVIGESRLSCLWSLGWLPCSSRRSDSQARSRSGPGPTSSSSRSTTSGSSITTSVRTSGSRPL